MTTNITNGVAFETGTFPAAGAAAQALGAESLSAETSQSYSPVSYTHLDVYKRQVLGLMDVKTEAYNTELDMFAACRKPAAAG